MHMGSVTTGLSIIHRYKHVATRRYINLTESKPHRAYQYLPASDSYAQISREAAIRHVFDLLTFAQEQSLPRTTGATMFEELAPLLKTRSFVLILTGLDDGRIRVNFIPKSTSKDSTDQDKALLTPLTIEGEPLELDEELAGVLTQYKASYLSMQESVDATKKQMADAKAAADAAAKEKADAAKTKKAGGAVPVKPSTPGAPGLFDGTPTKPASASLFASKPAPEEEDDDNDTSTEEGS